MILDNLRDIVRAASANHGGVVAAQRWATRSIGAAILDAYTLAADRGEGLACYRLCCQAVRQVCGEPELQSLFASHRNILRRFLAELDMPEHDPAVVVREWLFRSMWRDVWTSKLAYLREADRRRILQVRGLAALPQDWRSQGIIFAHWHAMFTESVWAWLAIEDIDPGIIIGRARWDLTLYEQNDPTTITLQSVIDLRRAQDALGHGRHVHILADGMSGLRGMELEWFGGRWEFQPGFAHLALRSGAPVHPISCRIWSDLSCAGTRAATSRDRTAFRKPKSLYASACRAVDRHGSSTSSATSGATWRSRAR
jgi:hypothetical protein